MGQKPLYKASLGPRLGPENFTSVFQKPGRNFHFEKKMLISLSFLGLLYVLDDYKQKKIFLKNSHQNRLFFYVPWNLADFQLMAKSR